MALNSLSLGTFVADVIVRRSFVASTTSPRSVQLSIAGDNIKDVECRLQDASTHVPSVSSCICKSHSCACLTHICYWQTWAYPKNLFLIQLWLADFPGSDMHYMYIHVPRLIETILDTCSLRNQIECFKVYPTVHTCTWCSRIKLINQVHLLHIVWATFAVEEALDHSHHIPWLLPLPSDRTSQRTYHFLLTRGWK